MQSILDALDDIGGAIENLREYLLILSKAVNGDTPAPPKKPRKVNKPHVTHITSANASLAIRDVAEIMKINNLDIKTTAKHIGVSRWILSRALRNGYFANHAKEDLAAQWVKIRASENED